MVGRRFRTEIRPRRLVVGRCWVVQSIESIYSVWVSFVGESPGKQFDIRLLHTEANVHAGAVNAHGLQNLNQHRKSSSTRSTTIVNKIYKIIT